jgi:amidase
MLNPYIEAHELRDLILKKEIKPREVAEFFIARVQKLNPRLGAFMTITPERAIADAERIEKMSDAERHRAPMFGVPYSIKDLNWTKDIPTSMGSKNYENFRPPADEEIVIKMRNAGGILLRLRALHGTSSIRQAGRAAEPAARLRLDSGRSRRAATGAARFVSRRHAAAWSESNRREGASPCRQSRARRGRGSRLSARWRDQCATSPRCSM